MFDLGPLRENYRRQLPASAARIRALLEALHAGDSTQLAELRRQLHNLRGSGGSYGIPSISEIAGLALDGPAAELLPRCEAFLELLDRESLPPLA